jgi:hypothetical protein
VHHDVPSGFGIGVNCYLEVAGADPLLHDFFELAGPPPPSSKPTTTPNRAWRAGSCRLIQHDYDDIEFRARSATQSAP